MAEWPAPDYDIVSILKERSRNTKRLPHRPSPQQPQNQRSSGTPIYRRRSCLEPALVRFQKAVRGLAQAA